MRARMAALLLPVLLASCQHPAPKPGAKLNEPPRVHVVAGVRHPTAALFRLRDDTVVLDAGFFVYALDAKGRHGPALVGDAASYVPLLPEAKPLRPTWDTRVLTGTRNNLLATGYETRSVWEERKWSKGEGPGRFEILGSTPPPGFAPPPGARTIEWRRYEDAAIYVGLVHDNGVATSRALVVKPPSTDHAEIAIEPPVRDCTFVLSADPHAWLTCVKEQSTAVLLRLDGMSWTEVRPQNLSLARGAAVGPDGTVWYPDQVTPLRIRRFLPGGHHDSVEIPDVVITFPASFDGARVHPSEEVHPERVSALLPTPSGEVWATVRTTHDHALVYRIGGDAPPGVAHVGSLLDQQIAAMNAVGTEPATRHCDPIFVPLGPPSGLDRKRDDILAAKQRGGFAVVGWHGERRIAGVLFPREDTPAIVALVDAFSEDPSRTPRPSCTPPVIERLLAD